jgi:cyclopropane fatty-acyl-phospholipid synthase-like methyltransferase
MQRQAGLYALLRRSLIYQALQSILRTNENRALLVRRSIRPRPGDRVVDLGCGPGTMVPYLPDTIYTGVDIERSYVDSAKARYGDRATFIHAGVDGVCDKVESGVDIVLAIGVLHHLNDHQARQLFRAARALLKTGGRLVTYDGVLTSPQHPIARLLIRMDRGRHIRTAESYLALAREFFSCIECETRHDLLRVPYDHFIMVCRREGDFIFPETAAQPRRQG